MTLPTSGNQQAGCQPGTAVPASCRRTQEKTEVLYFAAAFTIIALLAAALGFTGLAGSATIIAQVLFLVFVMLAALSLLVREIRRLEDKTLGID